MGRRCAANLAYMSQNKSIKKLLLILLVAAGLGTIVWWKQNSKIPPQHSVTGTETPQQEDMAAIRSFMGNPNLELTFINTDLPLPYFRVGKVTKIDSGENMEVVEAWIRKVNIYDQKELIDGECSVYEFNTDARSHNLTAVIIRGLRQSEIEDWKNSGTFCNLNSGSTQKLTKTEAETIAMVYLKRALPNFEQIKDQFVYSIQNNGESHEWLWEDRNYQLSEELDSRPYPNPVIRISVHSSSEIQYWNTISLFEN